MGMNGYLTKPFHEVELYTIISKYLKVRDTSEKEGSAAICTQSKLAEIEDIYGGNKSYVKEMAEIFLIPGFN
jgi:DNA-binding response OmpR family regulator